jgi:Resolvase, N terminal domain
LENALWLGVGSFGLLFFMWSSNGERSAKARFEAARCVLVRYYVAKCTAAAAEAYARGKGASEAEIESARHCLPPTVHSLHHDRNGTEKPSMVHEGNYISARDEQGQGDISLLLRRPYDGQGLLIAVESRRHHWIVSGRPDFEKLMRRLMPGDTVSITKLDSVARSVRGLWNILFELQDRECGFVSLNESWCDTTTDVGRLMITIMGGARQVIC